MSNTESKPSGFAGKLAAAFINSKLTPLGIIASLLLGILAVAMLPREEEPQIKVPMIDVMVAMEGATPKEIEEQVTIPMEKLLYELPDVEYIYSTSMAGKSLLIVRFYVGADLETAIVRLNQKLATNFDRIPHNVSQPLVKPHTIDDVPILALTLHSPNYDHFMLRRLAAQIDDAIKSIPSVAETSLIGGTRRQVTVRLDPLLLASRDISINQLVPVLRQANQQRYSGVLTSGNRDIELQTGSFLASVEEVGRIVVGVYGGKPVYLEEVAEIIDGPEEPSTYVLFGAPDRHDPEAAVTISVAKRPGANAVSVVAAVLDKVDSLKGTLIPADIEVSVTRDYGATASEKSNELLLHMGIAVFGVALLILLFLGWRESIVVMLAIPSTLALTLLVFYLYGYTLNRITLFALIFSIGILVDDAIVVVENIVRHLRLPGNRDRSMATVAVEAVSEVGNPTILATWAVIAAILPMAFVGGLMGPYMRPIPVGASAAMIFSLVIAFTVTPWAAIHILKRRKHAGGTDHDQVPDDLFTRLYHRIMDPLLGHGGWRAIFFIGITVLLLGAMAMVGAGLVKVKMLPFDNKSEFQVILDLPEGSTLEQTSRAAQEMARVINGDPAVVDYQVYVGTASPYNFNGLVRHYFLRSGPHLADIQVNLLPKHARTINSHDIAKRVRPELAAIAEQYGAALVVAEVPPGPPVLQTLVAEIYGPTAESRVRLAEQVKQIFADTDGVVDIDWYRETERSRTVITVDKEKAALSGITEGQITRAIRMAVAGLSIDLYHQPRDKEPINLVLELPRSQRARVDELLNLSLRSEQSNQAPLVPLRELVHISEAPVEQPIYRKNLKPVLYVTGDVAGAVESPVYAIFEVNERIKALDATSFAGAAADLTIYNLFQPFNERQPAMKWDGEWHITLEVFRDLGLAFCVVLILIYMLDRVGWFGYGSTCRCWSWPPVPLHARSACSPAHWAMGAKFTATSMIGFMAGAGIVVRNSIILVDFIELRLRRGHAARATR